MACAIAALPGKLCLFEIIFSLICSAASTLLHICLAYPTGDRVVTALYHLLGKERAEEMVLPIRWGRALSHDCLVSFLALRPSFVICTVAHTFLRGSGRRGGKAAGVVDDHHLCMLHPLHGQPPTQGGAHVRAVPGDVMHFLVSADSFTPGALLYLDWCAPTCS